jgi:hypothetical protein
MFSYPKSMLFTATTILQHRLQGLYGVEEASTTDIDVNMAELCILAAKPTPRMSSLPALR